MLTIYQNIQDFPFEKNSVITLGSFDGLHYGHRLIIDSVISEAERMSSSSVLITFNPHPREVIQKSGSTFKLLTTLTEKIEILQKTKLNKVLIIPFTREFSLVTAEKFIENYLLDKIGVKKVIIGHDHMFGHNRGGSVTVLHDYGKRFGFDVEVIEAQQINGVVVSSTKIREALEEGNIAFANMLLGRSYSLIGMVKRGDGVGHQIGFPTANIHIDHPKKLIPKDGVYVVRFFVSGTEYYGMCNIGFRPTFNGMDHRIEIHIFDFNQDIYGSDVTVSFIHRLRDEMKFNSKNDLIEQLKKDKEASQKIIAHI